MQKFGLSWVCVAVGTIIGELGFDLGHLVEPGFGTYSLPYQFLYIWMVMQREWMIVMIGFLLMDSSIIMTGLSMSKVNDEKKGEIIEAEHDRVKNLEIIKLYQSRSVSDLLTHWNMSTQAWLKYYVYVRMLPTDRSVKSNSAMPAAATFIVSATWHGFYSGYQLFFGTAAFFGFVDKTAEKLMQPRLTALGVPMIVQ